MEIRAEWVDHFGIEGQIESDSKVLPTYDFTKFNDRYMDFIGHRWVNFELIGWPKSTKFVDISVSLSGPGSVGLWIPSSDVTVPGPIPTATFGYYYSGSDHLFVDCKKWEFGKYGKVRIHNNDPNNKESKFTFAALLRPVFFEPKEISVSLKVTDHSDGNVATERYKLKPGRDISGEENQPFLMQEVFENFSRLEVMNQDGVGNIVHPKQYFTIRGFQTIQKEFFNANKNSTRIAYIGTDTTENIRSFLRWLNQSGQIDSVAELRFFYTTDWDKDFLEYSRLKQDILNHHPNLDCTFRELSRGTINAQKELPKCDVVISTFVTPWVNSESKSEFADLLRHIMGENSFLLSVDPKTGECSVRSVLANSSINNDLLYKKELKFIESKASIRENPSVEWRIWKPTSESGMI